MKTILVVLLIVVVCLGCSSVSVKSDYDREKDFNAYKTYSWYEKGLPNDVLTKNPLLRKRVVASVDHVLRTKGMTLQESGEGDLVAVVHAGAKERIQVTSYSDYGWYRPWWGGYGGYTDVSYYEEGTLVIDFVDSKEKELAWRGMGTRTIKDYSDQDKMQKVIDETVAKVLEQFPPR
jgi:hypothetical protein